MKCVVCKGKTVKEKMEESKKKRLLDADKRLDEEELHKRVCQECGHIAYVKDN